MIDKIQRAPHLLLAIKQKLDADNSRGQFLLTGSADLPTLLITANALPGRVQYLRLWPLTQGHRPFRTRWAYASTASSSSESATARCSGRVTRSSPSR